MLTQMRNASKGVLATILVGFLILSFGAWGIRGVFLPSPTNFVAKVGDAKIGRQDFLREFMNILTQQSRRTGKRMTPQEASRLGLDKMFLEQLITRSAYDQVVDDLGLTTPDSALRSEITKNEAFQGLTGKFDQQTYRNVLAENNFTKSIFEKSLRADMAREQLLNAVAGGIKLPRGMIEALYKYDAERRSARYLVLKPELVGNIPAPDKKELKSFHKAHAAQYTAPETRSFTYVLLRPKDILDQINVNDDDITREYESRKQQYVQPETRQVRQITYATRDKAEAALKKIKAGEDFLAAAKEKGLSPAEANLGNLRKEQFLDPAVGEAAFALKAPGLTGIIKGQFGFVIAQVVSITPSKTKSLAEVRNNIKKHLAMNTASGRIEKIRDDFEDALAAQKGTLEEIAKRLGLKAVTVKGVDKTGHTADGKRPAGLPKEPDVLHAAFENEEGEDIGFERLSTDGYFVVRIDNVKPSALRPLNEIHDRVAADWKADQTHQRLQKMAGAFARRANGGEDLDAIASKINLSVLSTKPPLRRDGRGSDIFSEKVLKDLFAAKPGEAVSGPVRNGKSFLVAKLTKILPPDISSPQARAALTQGIDRFDAQYGQALVQQYALALRKQLGVKRYEDVLAQTIAQAH